jgi:hypothetical protein
MKFLKFKVRKILYIPIIVALVFLYSAAAISPNFDVKHVYGVLPAFVYYNDNLLNEGAGGVSKGPLVIASKELKDDPILLTHELVHVKQSYRYLFFQWVPAYFSQDKLVQFECEAYVTEIKRREAIPFYARMIRDEYGPSVPIHKIELYLIYYWEKLQCSNN